MTVFDASVFVDALVVSGPVGDVARAALAKQGRLDVPATFLAESTSALRGLLLGGEIDQRQTRVALAAIRQVSLRSFPFEPFIDRVWELRHNLTVYDAWYVALAERLDTALVTADEHLVEATGPRCPLIHVSSYTPA